MIHRTVFNLSILGIFLFERAQKIHYQIDCRSFFIQCIRSEFIHIISAFLSDVRYEWRISIESNLDEPPCAAYALPAKYCRLNNYKADKQTLINAIADTPNSEPSATSKYFCLIL